MRWAHIWLLVDLFLTSVARSKPAMCGHFKTGHRTNVRDRDFYSYIRA